MRPHTPKQEALSEQLKVRLTKQEKERLLLQSRKEKFCSLSEFVRSRLLKKRLTKRIEVSDESYVLFRTLDYDLVKVGTNLNQVAHKFNAYNTYMLKTEDMETIRSCFDALDRCYKGLEKHLILMNLK